MTSVAGSYGIEQENIRKRTLFKNRVAQSVGQTERRWRVKRNFMAAIGLCLVLGLVFGAAMTVVANVDEGLLALWHMGEGSGSIIHDASGNGFDGTIYGATWTDGICGGALEFDGMDDYVGCGSIPVGAPAYESFTLEAWINTTSTSGVIIQRQYAGHWFHLSLTDGKLFFLSHPSYDSHIYTVQGTTMLADGKWHHVVGLRDVATRELKIYVDGSFENSVGSGFTPFYLGDISIGNYFTGTIDHVAIYNRALTASEIQQHSLSAGTGVSTATETGMAFFCPSQSTIEDLQAVATPSGAPVEFPHGMFSFKITGLSAGEEVTLTVELPGPVPVGTKWWKYHNNTWSPMDIDDDDGDNVITVALKDGRTPDDEDTTPGQITDQGGPGNPGAVGWETYTTDKGRVLLPWIALLAAIMAGASLLVVRRRRAQS